MNESLVASLLAKLKHDDEGTRDRATQELWRLWFEQKGVIGLETIRQAQIMLESGRIAEAEAILSDLIQSAPDFAEAWNRRAVLYYMQGRYRQAIADCNQVIELNPIHFGALHGLGLCHAAIGEYRAAIQAFRQALKIQPHSIANQRWILECTAKLTP
jgi:tetratricopeptide (TPR) repeat protein